MDKFTCQCSHNSEAVNMYHVSMMASNFNLVWWTCFLFLPAADAHTMQLH